MILIEDKNIHLEHIEDAMFVLGDVGLQQAISILDDIHKLLAGWKDTNTKLSLKWDGAPAIVCGNDSKGFWVGTKSALSQNPKLNYSKKDIDNRDCSAELKNILYQVLRNLSDIWIDGTYQGDILWIKDHLRIDNDIISFCPNTIKYTVPTKSPLGQKIIKSELGIVFHTKYVNGRAIFGKVPTTKQSDSVIIVEPYVKPHSQVSAHDLKTIISNIVKIKDESKFISSRFLNSLASNKKLSDMVISWINKNIREGKSIGDFKSLYSYILEKYEMDISLLKKETSKINKTEEKKAVLRFLSKNEDTIRSLIKVHRLIDDTKNVCLTYFGDSTEIRPTGDHEGLIAHTNNKALKLVNREDFSIRNFEANKNWKR